MEKLKTRQKIRISGYWLDDEEKLENQVCVVNSTEVREDDNEIFFYFDSWEDIESFKKPGVHDFVVTEVNEY
jgi:hypothetical protein